jgi:hypothetical protein
MEAGKMKRKANLAVRATSLLTMAHDGAVWRQVVVAAIFLLLCAKAQVFVFSFSFLVFVFSPLLFLSFLFLPFPVLFIFSSYPFPSFVLPCFSFSSFSFLFQFLSSLFSLFFFVLISRRPLVPWYL